jgi:hypothetical protein
MKENNKDMQDAMWHGAIVYSKNTDKLSVLVDPADVVRELSNAGFISAAYEKDALKHVRNKWRIS